MNNNITRIENHNIPSINIARIYELENQIRNGFKGRISIDCENENIIEIKPLDNELLINIEKKNISTKR